MFTALTIAGSDSSGGAGIQADLKTMSALGIYGMSAITALTAQNTTGVTDIFEVTPVFLLKQLDAVFTDIPPNAVKIGMLSGVPIMKAVAEKLTEYRAENIVLDPVMVATSGSRLMKEDASCFLLERLIPLADIITPNIPETEALTGMRIESAKDMVAAANKLDGLIREQKKRILAESKNAALIEMARRETAVLVKGGHSINDANDLLYENGNEIFIKGERIQNPNTHGTGCTLSSAIASFLAKGLSKEAAVRSAKEYLTEALRSNLDLGKGSGPVNHLWKIEKEGR